MSASARVVLIWLLVLSLPAQGLAAAGLVSCGPYHVATGRTVAALHATTADLGRHAQDQAQRQHPSRHEHGASAHAGAGHDGGHAHAASAEATLAAADFSASAVVSSWVHADDHQCSACASCCSAAAACTSGLRVAATAVAATAFIAVVPAVEKFAADGLDRPPRAILV